MNIETIISFTISSAWDVWRSLGYGFLENVYKHSLAVELDCKGFEVQIEYPVTVYYRKQPVGDYYCDLLINETVIIETKTVNQIIPAHIYQGKNYLKATGKNAGLIINFNKEGVEIKRIYPAD